MTDFLNNLYSNENFTLYLIIALVVLVILFVIVLLFGKKDQKLEETKRLQKIEMDTFKEKIKEPEKVEVAPVQTEIPIMAQEEVIPVEPVAEVQANVEEPAHIMDDFLNSNPLLMTEEPKIEEQVFVEPIVNSQVSENVNVTVFEPEVEQQPTIVEEKLTDTKEMVPPAVEEFSFDAITDGIEKDLNDLEKIKNEFNSIQIPKTEEVVQKPYQPNNQVFSSVFVNKVEEPKIEEPILNNTKSQTPIVSEIDDDDFDMPVLKSTPAVESIADVQPLGEEPKNNESLITIIDESLEDKTFAPTQEVKSLVEDKPFSFDDIIGESYNVK